MPDHVATRIETRGDAMPFPPATAVDTAERRNTLGNEIDLPSRASGKLTALKQAQIDAHAALVPSEQMREIHQEKAPIDRRLAELTRRVQEGGFGLDDDAPQVRAEKKKLARVTAEIARLKELDEVRGQRWTIAGQTVQKVEAFLRDGVPGGVSLAEADDIAPADILRKGEALIDAVERLRHRVRELKADLHRVRSSPLPKAVARKRLIDQIDALAANAPDTSQLIEHDEGRIAFPTKQVSAMVHNVQGGEQIVFVEVPDIAAIMATVMRDQLIAWCDSDLDQNADDKAALSPEQRETMEAEINQSLLQIEREESALVWKAMADGLGNVAHRPDANPLALLGLRLITAQAAPPPTPSWRSYLK
jgi:hypothetical protein